jgi:hypothetical protein
VFKQWQETVERFTKDWEQSSAGWWEQTLRDPKTLEQMSSWLNGACEAKERSDRALEDHWAQWRLPSSADLERVYERLGQVQESLGRLEERLSTLESPAPKAKPSPRKKTPHARGSASK